MTFSYSKNIFLQKKFSRRGEHFSLFGYFCINNGIPMDISRRKFFRTSALAAIGMSVMPGRLLAASSPKTDFSGRCSVEVLRCQCFPELQSRYLDDPEAGPCSRHHVGEKIEITPENIQALKKSGKICPHAWRALEPYVLAALSAGTTVECAPALTENQAVVSCPDGTRPVIFKVTAG